MKREVKFKAFILTAFLLGAATLWADKHDFDGFGGDNGDNRHQPSGNEGSHGNEHWNSPDNQNSAFVIFDAPGAGSLVWSPSSQGNQGTFALGINARGTIVGNFLDGNWVSHGFLRASDGSFVTFDAPGAGTIAFSGTYPMGINDQGATTGVYLDANFVPHGFVREGTGTFVAVNLPGAAATYPVSINDQGTVTGQVGTASLLYRGFVLQQNGAFSLFDAPGVDAVFGTLPRAINARGAITGSLYDSATLAHGFALGSNGTFTVFDPPGAGTTGSFVGTFPQGIGADGTIAGYYWSNDLFHGFLRDPDGTFTLFDSPNALTCCGGPWTGTFPMSINSQGDVTGSYTDPGDPLMNHGFLRVHDRTLVAFDAPGAGANSSSMEGTSPQSVNDSGAITGYFTDSQGLIHGFVTTYGSGEDGSRDNWSGNDWSRDNH